MLPLVVCVVAGHANVARYLSAAALNDQSVTNGQLVAYGGVVGYVERRAFQLPGRNDVSTGGNASRHIDAAGDAGAPTLHFSPLVKMPLEAVTLPPVWILPLVALMDDAALVPIVTLPSS